MLPLRFLLIPLLFLLLVLPSCSVDDGISGLSPLEACPAGLALHSVQALPLEAERAEARLRLLFTGVPSLGSLEDHLELRLEGIERTATLAHDPEDPSAVMARLSIDAETWAELDIARVALRLRAGTACHGAPDVIAPGASRTLDLVSDPPPVRVESVNLREGEDGYYLEVLCQDWGPSASEGGYTNGTPAAGERCMPDLEGGAGAVHSEPPLPLELAATRGGFLVYAPFEQGPLTLVIDAGTPTLDGGVLRREFRTELEVPTLEPRLSFLSQGRYLPRGALGRIAIRHRNVPVARLQVRHVPRENLLFWHSGSERADTRSSNLVLDQELTLASAQDHTELTWLNLGDLLPKASEGLYELTLRGHDDDEEDTGDRDVYDRWWGDWSQARAAVRVLLTDMQIVAKRNAAHPSDDTPAELLVWALDSRGSGPISGVRMELVRPSGAVVGRCTTDARGGCRIRPERDPVDPEPPFAILARHGKDTSVLELADLELDVRGDVHGEPYRMTHGARAAAWTDRGVYRPGDTVHLAALLRGPDDQAPPAGQPLTLRWLDSRGRELRSQAVAGNAAGMLTADLELQDYARTGRYRAVLELADRRVGEAAFMVEEIAPERMAVSLEPLQAHLLPDQTMDLELEAHWLFGSPAADSRVELICQIEPHSFTSTHAPQLHFGVASLPGSQRWSRDASRSTDTLDPSGEAMLGCPAAAAMGALAGPATLYARAEVFEGATGRTSKGRAKVTVHPERFHIGLAAQQDRARPGQPVDVHGLVVDWDGLPAPDAADTVEIEIQRLEREHSWSWDDQRQDFSYGSWVRRASEQSLVLEPQQGELSFSFTPAEQAWGYLVVATAGAARTELLVPGQQDHWAGNALWNTPGPTRAGWLEIHGPGAVRTGDSVEVSIEVPRAGWLLVSAETWEVHQHRWLQVRPGTAQWSFTLDDYAPNVYVSALLVQDPHAISDDSWLPGRAHGVRSFPVMPEPHQATLSMTVPESIEPHDTLSVELQLTGARGPAWVAVAAVDQGLISLTDHPVPDPLATLFSKRALEVDTFETVGWSLSLPSMASASTVGGDAAGRGSRVQAIEPVALWSGLVELPASGEATIELPLPNYRGELRVVAVAASGAKVATAHGSVTVSEPLLVQASTPRFLLDGDEAEIPISLHNLSEATAAVELSLTLASLDDGANGIPLTLRGAAVHNLSLEPGAQASLRFPVSASASQRGARIRVDASAPGLHSWQQVDLPIGSPLPREQRSQRVALSADRTELGPLLQGWSHHRTELYLTANPYADALSQVGTLLRYPYGCLEQTGSQTRVLLALGPMLEDLDPALAHQKPLDDWVQDGLDRLQRMQTWGGGFGYWPGQREPAPWASVFALHTLWDARQAGYSVPDQVMDDGLDYLARMLNGDDAASIAYAHYMLALAGRGQPALAMGQLAKKGGSRSQRYQLMAAVHLAGDLRFEDPLRDLQSYTQVDLGRGYRGYASPLRDQGLVLTTYRQIFGHDPGGAVLSDVVAEGLRSRTTRRATTQELAWVLTGLASSVGHEAASYDGFELSLAGEPLTAATPGRWSIEGDQEELELSLQAPDDLPQGLYLVLDSLGQRMDGDQPISLGAAVDRSLLDESGEVLDPATLTVGQRVYVRLRVSSLVGSQPRVALVERLPAGWELENPAMTGDSQPNWARDETLWTTEHQNLRDDRVESFGTLELAGGSVIYAARVVTAGRYTWPGALLEAMYDPRVRARTAPVRVEVAAASSTEPR